MKKLTSIQITIFIHNKCLEFIKRLVTMEDVYTNTLHLEKALRVKDKLIEIVENPKLSDITTLLIDFSVTTKEDSEISNLIEYLLNVVKYKYTEKSLHIEGKFSDQEMAYMCHKELLGVTV